MIEETYYSPSPRNLPSHIELELGTTTRAVELASNEGWSRDKKIISI